MVVIATFLLVLPSFDGAGAEMDEGGLVAYPSLILEGMVPGRDFETFYGPGGQYVVAAAFDLFGPSLNVERAVGLLYRLVIVLAIFVFVLPARVVVAMLGSLAAAVLLIPMFGKSVV